MKKTVSYEMLKKLLQLVQKQGAIKLNSLADEMNMAPHEALSLIRDIFPVGIGIEIYFKDHEYWIDFKNDYPQYNLPLSFTEWIQLHQIVFSSAIPDPSIAEGLRKKFAEEGPLRRVTDLLSQFEVWDKIGRAHV